MKAPFRTMLLLLVVLLAAASAWAAPFQVQPEPDWVVLDSLDPVGSVPTDEISAGVYYLLLDSQLNALLPQVERFNRLVTHVANEEGISDQSQVAVEFDPAYEELIFHSIAVMRGGERIEKLDPARVKVIQRETRLEYQIYDGTQTAVIFLDDIRLGDTIETRHTVRGENPVMDGRFTGAVPLQSEIVLKKQRHRVLWPEERTLSIRNHGSDIQPTIRSIPGGKEYVWVKEDVRPLDADPFIPEWFHPYPWVQLSEFESWGAVATWGTSLFEIPGDLPAPLREKMDELQETFPSPADLAMAAIRFVQDDIRYLGIELGELSHRPTPPDEVFGRRFGDCKDKSLLLVTLLRSAGIRADPALVHTYGPGAIGEWLPTPRAFNHTITRLELEGTTYWIDPTRKYQRGGLPKLYIPDYRYALVLAKGTTTLSTVKRSPKSNPRNEIRKKFECPSLESPATYRVRTTLEGREAEDFRQQLKAIGQDDLREGYLDYYTTLYPTIESAGDLIVEDNEERNRIRITEEYVIPGLWVLDEETKQYVAEFTPMEIQDLLPRPDKIDRTMPLGLYHPQHVICYSEIHLPEEWLIEPETAEVKDPAFVFHSSVEHRDLTLNIRYELETLADHVTPEQLEEYCAAVDEMVELQGYVLTCPVRGSLGAVENFNFPVAMIILLVIAGVTIGSVRFHRWLPRGPVVAEEPNVPEGVKDGDDSEPEDGNQKTGIGGWLVLLAIGITFGPISMVIRVIQSLEPLGLETWQVVTTVGNANYHPMYAPVLIFEACVNILLLACSILIMILFYQRYRLFPRLYVSYMLMGLGILIVDVLLRSFLPWQDLRPGAEDVRNIFAVIVALGIWGSYLYHSKRAKATFVR